MRPTAALLAIALGCGGDPSEPTLPPAPLSLELPAFGGGTISLREHRGQPVVLHLFTSWDANAAAEADQLVRLHAERGDEIAVIGVALDMDPELMVGPWRRELGVSYPIALATDAVRNGQSSLGPIRHVPTTIVLAPSGAVRTRVERPLRPGELEQLARAAAPR